jgi:hypothetical protein
MSFPRASAFPVHALALERHAVWARDFAAAGDLEASIDEIRDIRALASELGSFTEDVDRVGLS